MKRMVVCLALLAGLAAGCTSGGADPGGGASPSGAVDEQRALAVGRQFVQCARQHGQPEFPDPAWEDGQLQFGSGGSEEIKNRLMQVPEECRAILRQLPRNGQRHSPPSAEDLRRLGQFAECVRQHGIPEWPDPKSDGTFPIVGTPLESEGKSQRIITAMDACLQYWDKGIDAS
jgi:hypothetical protein